MFVRCALGCISCAAALSFTLVAQAAQTLRGKSPIGPPAGTAASLNMFEGRLKPVPELAQRDELGNVPIPLHPTAYDELDGLTTRLRDGKERTFSGIWKLPNLYFGYKDHYGYTTSDTSIESFAKAMGRWRMARPQSPTPIVIEGILLGNLAEKALQKTTTADVIGPEHFALSTKRVADARVFLLKHKEAGSQDPMWYATVVESSGSMCETLDHAWSMVDEGTTRFPSFHQLYFEYLKTASRCVDSLEDLAVHIKKIVDLGKSRAGEPGEAMYARSYWYIHSAILGEATFGFSGFDWQRMKKGIEDVLAQYQEPWNTNNFAKFACEAGDAALSRELLPKALEFPVLQVWQAPEAFSACWNWANASSDRAKPQKASR